MASHLDCIGVVAASSEQLQGFLTKISEDAVSMAAPDGGRLLEWQDSSGASIYIHLDENDAFLCMTPSFAGTTQHRVRPIDIKPDKDCPLCDILQVEVLDQNGQMFYPLLLQLENMEFARSKVEFGTICQLRVAGFAESAEFWLTEEAFQQSQGDQEPKFAAQSLIPSGMFGKLSTARAMLTGKVTHASVQTNSETGALFLHLIADSLGGTYDMVSSVPEEPVQPGAVVQCNCWMVGRIL